MIIGPNGTGKSSIACAIALGLNFPPAVRCSFRLQNTNTQTHSCCRFWVAPTRSMSMSKMEPIPVTSRLNSRAQKTSRILLFVEISMHAPRLPPSLWMGTPLQEEKLISKWRSWTFKLEIFGMLLTCLFQWRSDWSSLPYSSFLPQDRVTEFAAMSPQQLLKETQLAAGDENLTNWHTTLIGAGQELKVIQQVSTLLPRF